MKNIVIIPLLFLIFIFSVTSMASAKKFKCGCFDNKEIIDAVENNDAFKKKGWYPECVEKYKNYTSSVSIQESKVKVYIDSNNLTQKPGDLKASIRFRPRDGKCLDSIADGITKKILWAGAWCNNSSYKSQNDFKISLESKGKLAKSQVDDVYVAGYQVTVTGPKAYQGMVIYNFLPKTYMAEKRLHMNAICLENR
jgi:hypothetical protein